jgi:hypothetical protein
VQRAPLEHGGVEGARGDLRGSDSDDAPVVDSGSGA